MENTLNKTIELTLVGLDGNAYALMGAFRQAAKRQGWTADEIKVVIDECESKNYDHLLCTLMTYTREKGEVGENELDHEHSMVDVDNDGREECRICGASEEA